MAGERLHGYRFGVSQPCLRIDFSFDAGSHFDAGLVAGWLRDHLGLASLPAFDAISGDAVPGDAVSDGGTEVAAIALALDLYAELAAISQVPVFSAGRLLSQESDAGDGMRHSVALPVVDTLPTDLFSKLFSQALQLVKTALQQQPSAENIASVHAGIMALRDDVERRFGLSPPTVAVCLIAAEQHAPWRYLGSGIFQLGWGACSRTLGAAALDNDSAIAAKACAEKDITATWLRKAGFPVPAHRLVQSVDEARAAAAELGWPVVVKPANQERSIGVTIDIADDDALVKGFDDARATSQRVLVERQHPGYCHRIMVAEGEVLYTVERLPKCVIGDGEHTVTELVATATDVMMAIPPWSRYKSFPLDELGLACLAKAGFTVDSVPPKDAVAPLRPIGRDDWGGHVFNRTDVTHPENARLAIDAARVLGLGLAGVDLITTDITRPWHETGAVINEMNFSPQYGVTVRTRPGAERIIPAILRGDGRIPAHIVVGVGDLESAALALQRQRALAGERCHITTAQTSFDGDGERVRISAAGLLESF